MGWLSDLAEEITRYSGNAVNEEQLLSEIVAFRNDMADPAMLRSYPRDFSKFGAAKAPRPATIDLILSYLNKTHPELRLPFAHHLEEILLHGAGNSLKRAEQLILFKEVRRRAEYWHATAARIREKYLGDYALLRWDSHKQLIVEPFSLMNIADQPWAVAVQWLCNHDGLRLGDLLVNSYRFAGSCLCWSTDKPVEPVAIAFLRVSRSRHEGGASPVVMGGMVMGLMDEAPLSLFQSRIALIKLSTAERPPTKEGFLEFAESCAWKVVHDRVYEIGSRSDGLLPFLKVVDTRIDSIDARTALGAISPSDVVVGRHAPA